MSTEYRTFRLIEKDDENNFEDVDAIVVELKDEKSVDFALKELKVQRKDVVFSLKDGISRLHDVKTIIDCTLVVVDVVNKDEYKMFRKNKKKRRRVYDKTELPENKKVKVEVKEEENY